MSQPMMTLAKQRMVQTLRLYAVIFIPMWLMFVLNATILFGKWNLLGIRPREFGLANLFGIIGSWTMHADLAHIIGNTLLMAQILFLFGLFERNAFRTIGLLIIGSGLLTWLLGGSHSIHIGASGLAFAMMGYMLGGALFARRWAYLFACIGICFTIGAGFWLAMLQGLIPQAGISFAGHFGGLITGLLYGADSEQRTHQIRYRG